MQLCFTIDIVSYHYNCISLISEIDFLNDFLDIIVYNDVSYVEGGKQVAVALLHYYIFMLIGLMHLISAIWGFHQSVIYTSEKLRQRDQKFVPTPPPPIHSRVLAGFPGPED